MHPPPPDDDAPAPPASLPADSLTGLLNRDGFLTGLRRRTEEGAAEGSRRPFALLALDLDRFKSVNDTLGHAVGDALLRAAGRRLRSCVRRSDLAGRLGGDEFAVLLQHPASEAEAGRVAARLLEVLSRPFLLEGHSVVVGASAGIALFPEDADGAEALLRCADLALLQAKAEGRGDQRRFVPALRARAEARQRLETDLRAAIGLGQFELRYQPQIELASGRLAGFEALLRWNHPSRGLVPPAEFLPVAEEVGLILPIGEWVLRAACREAAGWADETLLVSVNVSGRQLVRPDLPGKVRAALEAARLPPERLELEVTETAVLHDPARALSVLRELRALGARVSLDDFGTGYSSLTHLRDFPLDRVKIDRTFVSGMEGQPKSAAIARAVADLGFALGLRTTAEGVETERELATLRGWGVTEAQGFFLGRPMAAEGARALAGREAGGKRREETKT